LLTALVLLATPLHDPGPPAPRAELAAALQGDDLPAAEPRVAERGIGAAAMPRVVARRPPTDDARVPAVIYETRRTVHRSRGARTPESGSDSFTLTAAPGGGGRRATAASLGTQSP
jgi:hypothetical protein